MPFAILPLLAAATAVAPPPLKPTGPWIVRTEEDMCLLERQYPIGNRTVSLIFQPLLDLDVMDVFVIGDGAQGDRQFTGTFTAGGEPGARSYEGRYLSVVGKSKVRLTRLSARRTMLDDLHDGDTLAIRAKPVDRRFAIVRPDQARVALATCVANLKKAWGIDPENKDRTAVPLDGDPARYFTSRDYPAAALSVGAYGRVIALLSVDERGAVGKCRVLSSAGASLNAGTCKAAMAIRFKPARDMDGKPLPSTYVLPVRWVLPGTE